jgi:hypothetical protein
MLSCDGFAQHQVTFGYYPEDVSGCIYNRHATDAFRVKERCNVSNSRVWRDCNDVSGHDIGSSQHDFLLILAF